MMINNNKTREEETLENFKDEVWVGRKLILKIILAIEKGEEHRKNVGHYTDDQQNIKFMTKKYLREQTRYKKKLSLKSPETEKLLSQMISFLDKELDKNINLDGTCPMSKRLMINFREEALSLAYSMCKKYEE